LIIINLKENLKFVKLEKLGGNFYDYICKYNFTNLNFINSNIRNNFDNENYFYDHFIQGARLKSYKFEKYKSEKRYKKFNLNIIGIKKKKLNNKKKLDAIIHGVNLTKELVSEPGNILHPDEYVSRILN
jgi:leucyl aminopeptidase